jgi:uncharacterized membrane protein
MIFFAYNLKKNLKIMENESKKELKIEVNPLAVLSYLSFLCLIPLLLKSDNFVKFHAKQGFTLFVLEVILMMIGFLPLIGFVINIFGGLFCLTLSLIGIFNVIKGKKEELPLIGQYAKIWKI